MVSFGGMRYIVGALCCVINRYVLKIKSIQLLEARQGGIVKLCGQLLFPFQFLVFQFQFLSPSQPTHP